MVEITVLYVLFIFVHSSSGSHVFHEKTAIKFEPPAGTIDSYFGYSIALTPDGIYVGAPKAFNQFTRPNKTTTGLIFFCPLRDLNIKTVNCILVDKRPFDKNKKFSMRNNMLMADSWFGSAVALVNNKLLVTAPRVTTTANYNGNFSLLQGSGYIFMNGRIRFLEPLKDGGNVRYQMYTVNGSRSGYGALDTQTYYFSLGQFGFSMDVNDNTLIFGAPGLLKSTGGIISYTFDPNDRIMNTHQQPITNPYNTEDLESDDNFGYSVASGIFVKNGSLYYVGGAPRSELGRGKVLIIAGTEAKYKNTGALEIDEPLDVKTKLMGPQTGSYFGASLCCTDINGDGLDDLLVGAPTFAKKDDSLPYDQGAVFVYITKETDSEFVLEPFGYVSGSGANAARFGTAIADLGDIDGDTFRDIAIGAPWEDEIGAVYIYMGYEKGLKTDRVQKIKRLDASGFGWSITKGLDIDKNGCNDVVVGAYNSSTAYLYRCVSSMHVRASIKVANDNKVNLPINATTFTAMFCVSSPPIEAKVKLNLTAKIKSDPRDNRSSVIGDSQYSITVSPGDEVCNEKTFYVDAKADLFKPITLHFDLEADELMKENSTTFLMEAARLSDISTVSVSLPVEVMRDCGDDLFCVPWLNITLTAMTNTYIPGETKQIGFILSAWNLAEPAYGLSTIFTLPLHPKRIPAECTFEHPKMTCTLPQPFTRNESVVWEVEMDYNVNTSVPISLKVVAELNDTFHRSNISVGNVNEIVIDVVPQTNFSVSGKAMPNETLTVMRSSLGEGANITFIHLFAITNKGPSDWYNVTVDILIPDKTRLAADIVGCKINKSSSIYECRWSIPAKVSMSLFVPLQVDLSLEGNFLKRYLKYNATTAIFIHTNQSAIKPIMCEVTTRLVLEPANLLWCIVVPCVFLGLLLLAIIIRVLHKCGFFKRSERQRIKRLSNMGNQNLYRTMETSDTDHSSQIERDNEHFVNDEDGEINVSVDTKRSSYHVTHKS